MVAANIVAVLQILGGIFALLTAVASCIGGVKARGLTPDSSRNIRELVETLDPFLSNHWKLLDKLEHHVGTKMQLPQKWPTSDYVALQIARDSARKAHNLLTHPQFMSTRKQTDEAVSARAWMMIAMASGLTSAGLQFASYWVTSPWAS